MVCVKLAHFFGMKSLKKTNLIKPINEFLKENTNVTVEDVTKMEVVKKEETFTKHIQNIEEILKENQTERQEDNLREEKELKFKLAAAVIDRLFFFLAIIYFLIAFSSLIMSIPNFYKIK